MLSTTLTYTLLLSLARLAIGAPAPVRESADSDLAKRQNAPDFGGWNEGQNVTELIFELNQQVTPIDRDIKLPADGFVFNFMEANSFGGGGKDGGVILADNTLFPGVVGNSMSWLVGFLGPCGMVAPHNHPRAAEYLMNIAGPPLAAGTFNENGSPFFSGELAPGEVTVLPLGSVHFVSNTGCDPVLIAAAFNSETPGVGFLASMYTAFDPETIQAAFGDPNAQVFDTSRIPGAVNLGHASCLKKCGINPDTFNMNGKVSNPDLMNMAFAGYLKSKNFDYEGYNSNFFQQFN